MRFAETEALFPPRFRNIGSGAAASYRRLPLLEPLVAPSWHVPLPVLTGPSEEAIGRITDRLFVISDVSTRSLFDQALEPPVVTPELTRDHARDERLQQPQRAAKPARAGEVQPCSGARRLERPAAIDR